MLREFDPSGAGYRYESGLDKLNNSLVRMKVSEMEWESILGCSPSPSSVLHALFICVLSVAHT